LIFPESAPKSSFFVHSGYKF